MATLLQLFRRRKAWAHAAFMVGATVKLAPYLTTPLHAQQNVGVNVRQIGSVDAVSMPFICDNSTGVLSTVIHILSTQTQVVAGSTKSVYVCGFSIGTGDSTSSFKWVEGTSTDCITGQADKTGLYRASSMWTMVENGGGGVLFKTSSANSLCIDATSSGLQGRLTYYPST